MESLTTMDPNKIYIEYDNIGFFHGYYIWKGYTALCKLPNWLGKIITTLTKVKEIRK